jgi:O-methyltransferase involved in polyketide biosynthesis
VDLVSDSLGDGLRRAGFDFTAPAFVSWLGVTMYLDQGVIERTASVLGALAPGPLSFRASRTPSSTGRADAPTAPATRARGWRWVAPSPFGIKMG